jgi:hypothetical protein
MMEEAVHVGGQLRVRMEAHESRRVIECEWQLVSNLNQTRIRTSFRSITVKEDVRRRYRILYDPVTY